MHFIFSYPRPTVWRPWNIDCYTIRVFFNVSNSRLIGPEATSITPISPIFLLAVSFGVFYDFRFSIFHKSFLFLSMSFFNAVSFCLFLWLVLYMTIFTFSLFFPTKQSPLHRVFFLFIHLLRSSQYLLLPVSLFSFSLVYWFPLLPLDQPLHPPSLLVSFLPTLPT